jgi:hypothetical protein
VPSRADSTASAFINKQLDSQQNLDLNGILPAALEQISNTTGVPIEADPAVWELLPWGQQTNLTARIEHHTLRESLDAITQKLGLQWNLTGEAIRLSPVPALRRLGRRSTTHELATLTLLNQTALSLTTATPTVGQLLDSIDKQLQSMKQPSAVIENRAHDATQLLHLRLPRGSTLNDALETIDRQTAATWYPWGRSIVVLPKHEQIRALLTRRLTTRYDGVDVAQVLIDLFQRAGVDFSVEPGAYQRIPPEDREIRLALESASIQQALDAIGGYTGLAFDTSDDGVRVSTAAARATTATATATAPASTAPAPR